MKETIFFVLYILAAAFTYGYHAERITPFEYQKIDAVFVSMIWPIYWPYRMAQDFWRK